MLASAMCLAFVIAACGSNSSNSGGTNDAAASSNLEPDLVIQASNWKFDQEDYAIKAGEPVNIKLDSVEGVHALKINKTKYTIKNDQTITVNFDKPGTYKIICSLPCGTGHSQMVANLIVE